MFYDWDGTLLDSAAATYRSYQRLFASFGISFDRDRFEATYAPDWYHTYRALGLPESAWARADSLWLEYYREAGRAPMPAAAETVRRVNEAGLAQGVVTSGERQRVVSEMAALGLSELLPTVVCAGDAHRPKPHPDPLLLALARVGVVPERVVFIGDSPEDVRMARAAGVHVIGVPGGFPNRQALVDSGPDHLLPNLAAAADYLLADS